MWRESERGRRENEAEDMSGLAADNTAVYTSVGT